MHISVTVSHVFTDLQTMAHFADKFRALCASFGDALLPPPAPMPPQSTPAETPAQVPVPAPITPSPIPSTPAWTPPPAEVAKPPRKARAEKADPVPIAPLGEHPAPAAQFAFPPATPTPAPVVIAVPAIAAPPVSRDECIALYKNLAAIDAKVAAAETPKLFRVLGIKNFGDLQPAQYGLLARGLKEAIARLQPNGVA